MKKRTHLFLVLALLLCLSLAACGDTGHDDTQPNGGAPASDLEPVTDMAFLDGMWSIDGITKLHFDSEGGFYAYRSYWGLGGRGEFSEVGGEPVIEFNGFLYDFLLRDDGVLLPNQNGDGDGLAIHYHTFRRDDEEEIVEWDASNWDGNSFTLSGEYPGRYSDDGHFDGVFYRNGDLYTYTDLENAEFYYGNGSDMWLWYHDGVNDYFLGDEYSLGDDGLAYHDEDGLIYPAGWIPEAPYDPAAEWGEDWMDNISPEAAILYSDTLDPHSSLYFSLCD